MESAPLSPMPQSVPTGLPPPQNYPTLQSEIQLSFRGKNMPGHLLNKCDPFLAVYEIDSNSGTIANNDDPNLSFIKCTEAIKDSPNPIWKETVSLTYFFEKNQVLHIRLFDCKTKHYVNDLSSQRLLGNINIPLGQIVSAGSHGVELTFTHNASGKPYNPEELPTIYIIADTICQSRLHGYFDLRIENIPKPNIFGRIASQDDHFLQFIRLNDAKEEFIIKRTETVYDTYNPNFVTLKVPIGPLIDGNWSKTFIIRLCRDFGEKTPLIIGETHTSLQQLLPPTETPSHHNSPYCQQIETILPLQRVIIQNEEHAKHAKTIKVQKKNDYGVLHIQSVRVQTEFTFIDYLQSGLRFSSSVGYDFSLSNGDPRSIQSLHYINPKTIQKNHYISISKKLLLTLQTYTKDDYIGAYGFSGYFSPYNSGLQPQIHDVFPLNLNYSPSQYCLGIDNLIQTYVFAVQHVQLSGPTYFCPILERLAQIASLPPSQIGQLPIYHVLVIITDGCPDDWEEFLYKIAEHSDKPLSVIIVGIGLEDFYQLRMINNRSFRIQKPQINQNNDNNNNNTKKQIVSNNDIIISPKRQYVQFFHHDQTDTAVPDFGASMLQAIPEQVTSFMMLHHINPPGMQMLEGDYNAVISSQKLQQQ